MVVVYFKHNLENFKFPKSWTRSSFHHQAVVSSEASPEVTIVSESELQENIQLELNSSLAFERILQSMVAGDYLDVGKIEDENDEITKDETEPELLFGSVHVPVVSILSPNLGLIAGCRARQHRIDYTATVPSVTKKRLRSSCVIEEDQENVFLKPKKTIKSHLVKALNVKVNEELDASKNFEQKLLDALN